MVELVPIGFAAIVGLTAFLLGVHWLGAAALFMVLAVSTSIWFEGWILNRDATRYCRAQGWRLVRATVRKNHYVLEIEENGTSRVVKARREKGSLKIVGDR